MASDSPVTLKDIAHAIGVSVSVVSRALKNSPRVAPAMRQRVREVAQAMGYHPNPMAAGLARFRQTSTVKPVRAALAWLNFWPEPKKLRRFVEFDRYWEGAKAAAERLGYRLDEFSRADTSSTARLANILIARGVNGVLLPPGPVPEDFHWERFSIVRLARPSQELPVHCVASDQMENALVAFDAVLRKGYKRIGFAGIEWWPRRFGAGYLWAQAGLPARLRLPPLFLKEQAPRAEREKAFVAWVRKVKPDAIITDMPEVLPMLKKAGCRVPEDVGLAGLNILDTPFDAGIHPNAEEIGRVAILVLISLINDHDQGFPAIPREILIPGKWVDGASLPLRE